MKKIVLLFFFVPVVCFSQQKWSPELFKTITYKNFRNNEIFNQQVDYKNLDYSLLNACLFFLCDEQRANRKIRPLEYCLELEKEATMHSTDMAEKHFFSHINPSIKTKKDPDDRAKLVGIINPHIVENIAKNNSVVKTYLILATIFHNQWMASENHKKNMFSSIALQMGCGTFYKDGEWFATQCFQCYEKAVTNNHSQNTITTPHK